MQENLTTALAGMAIGLLVSMWASRFLNVFLFEVKPIDLTTHVAVSLFLIVVCLASTYLPSVRVLHLKPIDILKSE